MRAAPFSSASATSAHSDSSHDLTGVYPFSSLLRLDRGLRAPPPIPVSFWQTSDLREEEGGPKRRGLLQCAARARSVHCVDVRPVNEL